jgi:hypothetical protein
MYLPIAAWLLALEQKVHEVHQVHRKTSKEQQGHHDDQHNGLKICAYAQKHDYADPKKKNHPRTGTV